MTARRTINDRVYNNTLDICCHPVYFWFKGFYTINNKLRKQMNRKAGYEARLGINNDKSEGVMVYEDGNVSFQGGWNIGKI